MKSAIGITLVFATVVMFAWNSGPRLMNEIWRARDFVPAQDYKITNYKCTNWNGFMYNDCTVTFVALQRGPSREITDWRFGRAPRDPLQLLQRRGDASSVTTDVALRTLWNRVSVALAMVVFAVVGAIGIIARTVKDEDAPVGAPGSEPMQAPAGRSTFGKRGA